MNTADKGLLPVEQIIGNEGYMGGRYDHMGHTAFQAGLFDPKLPSFYRRTYMFGILIGPLVATIAGLFDYDCAVWVYRDKKFRPFIFCKRKKS